MEPAVVAEGLTKAFGSTRALDGFDLTVPAGTVCGLLGPNGAGKSTAVRILSTLLRPDGGRVRVAGFDVVGDPVEVRYRIGLVGQQPAVDEMLTGRENLEMFGRLYRLGPAAARRRAAELLETFDLGDAADRRPKGYSGGMRRRLDLAISFVMAPPVLFLDEPTTGMDPGHRLELWHGVRTLVAQGTTVLLTTHYLDEADQLADEITVIDHGRVIARGTPDELKSRLRGDRIDVLVGDAADVAAVGRVLAGVTGGALEVDQQAGRVSVAAPDRVAALARVARALDDEGVAVRDIALRRPTLDEVFVQFTKEEAA
ncbi:ATP-binding cassette domain-containing protein [Jiangella sp. DSM 45060]|uniref:ATP-binding cassette domain-containing protein n=1 Tax=Jiangella sp. DSM 45060 TaxID=1798224 RepID=UPI0008799C26|nr:ATP-binding cassette domain-containing protein [Jiangella sp. DSM 45060]SDT44805.1 ABC-2 type transport system ATP-binding protein [Jiangella sp. DSM 45060]